MTTSSANMIIEWLQKQCQLIEGSVRAVVMLGDSDNGSFQPVAQWPGAVGGAAVSASPALSYAAAQAIRSRRLLLQERSAAPEQVQQVGDIIACPILREDQVVGVVAVEMNGRKKPEQQAAAKTLQTNIVALRALLDADVTAHDMYARNVIELVAAVIEQQSFTAAARAVTSRFAALGDLRQVSLGIVHKDKTQLQAISGRATLHKEMQANLDIAAAMDEAIGLDTSCIFAVNTTKYDSSVAAHAALIYKRKLADKHQAGVACSVPISHAEKLVGAFTFEHNNAEHFDAETVAFCEAAVALVGPLLHDKYLHDRTMAEKFFASLRSSLQQLTAPDTRGRVVLSTFIVGLLSLPFIFNGQYRVTADASLEGAVRRVIAAPVEGYVAEAPARPGDIVSEGDLLARLDDGDLELERVRLASEKKQLEREYRSATAEHDDIQVTILRAQIDRADAQLQLTEERLSRASILAPMDGVVVEGDLSQSLGAPVEKGQQLFQIAPLDAYRVMLKVDEREVGALQSGQEGQLALVGFPGETLAFSVERITPIASQSEGRNFFLVEASLLDVPARLRPGMEGVGKIDIDERKFIWIWTHELTDWVRLQFWRWKG
jgi:RND family efflux transporter MFP subunit